MADEKDNTIETIEKIIGIVGAALPLIGQVGLGLAMIIAGIVQKWNGPEQTKEELLARIKAAQERDLSWK